MAICNRRSIGFRIILLLVWVLSAFHTSAFSKEFDLDSILITAGAEWYYSPGNRKPQKNWYLPEFNSAHWKLGKAGFGYGDNDDRTYLKSMRGEFDSVRIRHGFLINSPESIKKLFLYIRYDDAFIAYLNGQEIARSGVSQRNGRRIVKSHEARGFEVFNIVIADKLLREGENVLAIVGFNRSLDSSDFSLHPLLSTQEIKNPELTVPITKDEILSDLSYLEQRLNDQSSYILRQKFDYPNELKKLRKSIGKDPDILTWTRNLQKFITRIGDAHAKVKADMEASNDRYLPFVIADSSKGFVALSPDRESFLEPDYPIVESIDNKTVSHWLEIASAYVTQASPQLIRRESLRQLRSIDRIREENGYVKSPDISVTLASIDGARKLKRSLKTSGKRLRSGKVVLGRSRILKNNIGYLRISSMKKSKIDKIVTRMTSFRDTSGLIIDVRGNRGGRYGMLRALYGYFVSKSASPYVSNIAAYRLSTGFEKNHLYYRPTYRQDHPSWTSAERGAIRQALANFTPEWILPKKKFSAWHFMLLGKSGDNRQYHYQNPVAVLSDAASFSATDGFLSAFSDLPGVKLIGQASAGGSGATRVITLPNTGIRIALSSMASFRPNGKLFDGRGIDVDILIEPAPGDFLGKSDAAMEKAVEWLKTRAQRRLH
ncbi:MAG: S41 family peptidase [Candidatus Scalindua sp.]